MASTNTSDLLQKHLSDWQIQLQIWAASGALVDAATEALLLDTVPASLKDLNSRLATGDWSDIPRVELLSGSGMGGAIGAWAESTQTIYLNSDWLTGATEGQINEVLTEEFGHYLDSRLNEIDNQGDEGEYFSRILGGEKLSANQITAIRSEDDTVILKLQNEKEIKAEAATLTGSEGNDTITGTDLADTISGRSGNDTIGSLGGDDTVSGGAGSDNIDGGEGDNSLYGFIAYETYSGAPPNWDGSNDTILAGAGNDRILSVGGNIIDAGNGSNYIFEWLGYLSLGFSGNTHNQSSIYTSWGAYYWDLLSFNGIGASPAPTITTGSGKDFVAVYRGKAIALGGGDDVLFSTVGTNRQDIDIYDGGSGYDKVVFQGASTLNKKYDIDFSKLKNFEEITLTTAGAFSGEFVTLDLGNFISDENKISKILVAPRNLGGSGYVIDASRYGQYAIEVDAEYPAASESYVPIKFYGTGAADIFTGGYGWNLMIGGKGDDRMIGNKDNDTFTGGEGNDYFDGGDGIDTKIYSGNSSDYTITEITYNTFQIQDNRIGSPDGTDTIIDVNKLRFADGDQDVVIAGLNIVGDDSAEEINGGSSADYINGAGGNDAINGEGGNDDLVGGNGNDSVNGGQGNDFIDGDDGNDQLYGEIGNDQINGGAGDDYIYSDDGEDLVDGGEGNDVIVGGDGRGDDTYNGGEGEDTVIYKSSERNPVEVNLRSGFAKGAEIGSDTLKDIEHIVAGQSDDLITGDARDNKIDGLTGRDTVVFKGLRAEYLVSRNSGGKLVIQDKVGGRDGSDTLDNVELFKFADDTCNADEVLKGSKDALIGEGEHRGEGKGTRIATQAKQADRIILAPSTFTSGSPDIITGFLPTEDKIVLPKAVFAKLKSTKITTISSRKQLKKFKSGLNSSQLVYNKFTGELIYDDNGKKKGLGKGGVFARFDDETLPILTANNFELG